MPVTSAVVEGGAVLERLLDALDADMANAIRIGRRRLRGQLEGIERDARVPADDLRERGQRLVLDLDTQRAQAALFVGECGF